MSFPFLSRPSSPSQATPSEKRGLGTFGGVYTPSILTILGVIMYLRFGWVVGSVGLISALGILTLSSSITFLTSLSIAAISTDRIVRTGGAYYMISRSLGIETGGAVGLALYCAQSLSIVLHTLGFAESVVATFPGLNSLYVSIITVILVGILAITSASLAIKTQYFIMAGVLISIASFVWGSPLPEVTPMGWLGTPPPGSASFWTVFAVFFPAVTGILAGVSMSGDLKNPVRSIPDGTLAAVGTAYVIYFLVAILLAMRADATTLLERPLIMQEMAWWGPGILLGIWGASLSTALGLMLAAPRVLQALARDGVLPRGLGFLGRGSGRDDEPRLGTVVTLGVATAFICVGDLDLIAPILSMFFLTTYLVLNLAAGIEDFLQSPSYRPSFRVPWYLSIFGAVGCLAVMLLIDGVATAIAAIIVSAIFLWLERRELEATWGDVRRGIWMAILRTGIFQLDHAEDPKNWRPHLLVLSGIPRDRWLLIQLADHLTHNRGLMTIAMILPESSRNLSGQRQSEVAIREYMERRGVKALVRAIAAPDPFEGAVRLVETYGLGPLVPNTVLLGDSESLERRHSYCEMITQLHAAKRSVIILRENSERGFGEQQRIDIWWRGMQTNGGLMLLLAYLLSNSVAWHQTQILIKVIVKEATVADSVRLSLEQLIGQLRIGAIAQAIVSEDRSFQEILHESSHDADLIFLGLAKPEVIAPRQYSQYYDDLHQKTADLPSIVYVLAAPDFAFEEVLAE